LITGGDHVLIAHYGKTWQRYRKAIHQHFMETTVEKDHLPLQQAEASQLLHDFLLRPDQHMWHPKRYTNSIACGTIWGVRSPDVDTEHMKRLYELMEDWSVVMEPGNTPPVDIFPALHYIPEAVFGNWRSRASDVGKAMNALYGDMLTGLEKRREAVGPKYSFMDRVLDQKDKLELNRHQLYFLGGTMMEGASDTSSSIIIAAMQAFVKWPEVARKAQREIDGVMGEDRSPVWSDYASLPYVAATVKEAMRWRPVVPLAFPHAVDEGVYFLLCLHKRRLTLTYTDDWIDGYKIPKGSVVFINAWGMHHDERRFPDPDTFDPDHYKGVTALASELAQASNPDDRDHYGYGSGRRLCPGIHLAERNLFLGIAKLLWAFDFAPGKDDQGNVVEPDTDPATGYSEGFLVCAKPFALDVQVRSDKRRETILKEYQEATRDVFSSFEG
jgi:cytochrome P450